MMKLLILLLTTTCLATSCLATKYTVYNTCMTRYFKMHQINVNDTHFECASKMVFIDPLGSSENTPEHLTRKMLMDNTMNKTKNAVFDVPKGMTPYVWVFFWDIRKNTAYNLKTKKCEVFKNPITIDKLIKSGRKYNKECLSLNLGGMEYGRLSADMNFCSKQWRKNGTC